MWLEGYTLNNKLILEHSVPKASQGQRLMANSNPSSTSLPSGICTVEYCRSDWTWPQNEERLQKLPLGTLRVSWLWGHLGGWTRTAVRVCVCVLYVGVAAVTMCSVVTCKSFGLHLPFVSALSSITLGLVIHSHHLPSWIDVDMAY